jgi:hypothetical protein
VQRAPEKTFSRHEPGLLEARQTLDLLARTPKNQELVDDTGRAVLHVADGAARRR